MYDNIYLTFPIQGAFIGFLASYSFNSWILVGKFLNGGGAPERLPLSVDGCASSLNATLENLSFTTLAPTTVDQ